MRSIILLLMIFPIISNAQLCGNQSISADKVAKIKKLIKSFNKQKDYGGEIPIVRLTLNNVVREDGTDGFLWSEIYDLIDDLSDLYNNKICFTVIDENTIANDDYFGTAVFTEVGKTREYKDLIMENPVDNAIRLYFVDEGDSGGVATGFLFDDDEPTVYLSNGFNGKDGNGNSVYVNSFTAEVLAHEIGHVLGLFHTHEDFYNEKENVARTGSNANCEDEGDLLCDTPADPNLLFMLNASNADIPNCLYLGDDTDPIGVAYDPFTDNIMSYTHPTCMQSLTTGQINRILDFMQQSTELDNIIIPEIIDIEGVVSEDRYYHADEQIISSAEHTDGIVDYRARQTITLSPGFQVTANSNLEFTAKIDGDLCHNELINNSGLLENEISTREQIRSPKAEIYVYPNPTQDILYFENLPNLDVTLNIFNLDGRLIKTQNVNQTSGQVDVFDLPKGIYFFRFGSSKQSDIKRIVIQ